MNILTLTCSSNGTASESYQLAQRVVAQLVKRHPQARVQARDLWAEPLPHVDGDYAMTLGGKRVPIDGAAEDGSLAMSSQLIAELERADCLVIGTPMHNFTVPSVLKAWIDHIVRIRRTFNSTPQGKVGLLPDRPVYVAIASGGRFSGESGRQPDFLTPYLRTVLGVIGLHDVTFFAMEGLAGGADAVALARRDADAAMALHFG